MMTPDIILALVLFQFAHFLGDFVFVTKGMVEAKKNGCRTPKEIESLFIHCGIHGILFSFTFLVVGFCSGMNLFLSGKVCVFVFLVVLMSHFLIDAGKALLNRKFNDPKSKSYWIIFGADALWHNIIIILLVYLIELI